MVDSDIRYRGKPLVKTILVGFVGGWVAGALGLGGGAIYNPVFLSMGIAPKVSSATGLYLVCFSKIAACFIYFMAGQLDIGYGIYIGAWSTLGSLAGVLATNWYMRVSGR